MEQIVEKIKNRFGDKVQITVKTRERVFAQAEKEDLKEIIRYLFIDLGARMSIATAVDTRAAIEILYHMAFDQAKMVFSVRIQARKPEAEVDSITSIIEGADWIEREIHEMFGVNFIGHPKLERLLLPDDWPEGEYPLLKKESRE